MRVTSARFRWSVDAFFAAARRGDFDALVTMLDPDVVVRADGGAGARRATHGPAAVASQAITYANPKATLQPVLVNGVAGVVVVVDERPFAVMAFTVSDGLIVAIDSLYDPERMAGIDLSAIGDSPSTTDD